MFLPYVVPRDNVSDLMTLIYEQGYADARAYLAQERGIIIEESSA